jgi:hypothetical protein
MIDLNDVMGEVLALYISNIKTYKAINDREKELA